MNQDSSHCFSLDRLEESIEPIRATLINHPIYSEMRRADDLRWFMENHVFAVWDFMVLLKALQRKLTSIGPIWRPVGSPAVRRLINEIVLGEESDLDADGKAASHFEMYLDAMRAIGASTKSIERFVDLLVEGADVEESLDRANAPAPARQFVRTTLSYVASGSLPSIAAAFTFGREDLIPEMFQAVLTEIDRQGSASTSRFRYYLARHIELDGESHSGLARQLVTSLCQSTDDWHAATETSRRSLIARKELWDGVLQGFQTQAE